MISSNKVKLIQSLDKRKFRQKYNLFVIEGIKTIKEFYNSNYELAEVFAIESLPFISSNNYSIITPEELKRISFLKTPHNALALVRIPEEKNISCIKETTLALDSIQDPGNLGTIIRLADWFGIKRIICSNDTVDKYNPKVVQGSMGSLARVEVHYTDLNTFLEEENIYTTELEGENIYTHSFPENITIVLGNEGNGISDSIKALSTQRITIPQFGGKETESLNVATACGIILGEIFSQKERKQ